MKKTAGQLVADHNIKNIGLEDDVIEYRRMMEPSIIADIHATIAKALKCPVYDNKDFYIVLLMNTERMLGALQFRTFARRSCPTPVYQQGVWKYHYASGTLEFLWSIPDQVLYWHVYHNAPKYLKDKECYEMARTVCMMESGELLEWVIKENGEKPDVIISVKEAA